MKFKAALIVMVISGSLAAAAQFPDLEFEVASIKPNKSGSNRVSFSPQPNGRFTATNVSVMDIIVIAFGDGRPFLRSNIVGAPSWAGRDRFDLVAKADGNPTQDEFSRLLRPLLAERFHLIVHSETLSSRKHCARLIRTMRRSSLPCRNNSAFVLSPVRTRPRFS